MRRSLIVFAFLASACTSSGASNPPLEGEVDTLAGGCDITQVTVYFEPWSAELTPAALDLLDGLHEMDAGCRAERLDIYAYGDAEGGAQENLDLTAARAAAVRDQLLAYGAPSDIISLRPRGQEGALTPDGTPVPQYRRAVIVVTPAD